MMEATMEMSSRMLKDWCPRKTRQCMPGRLQCMPSHTCSSATGIVRNTVSASRMPLRFALWVVYTITSTLISHTSIQTIGLQTNDVVRRRHNSPHILVGSATRLAPPGIRLKLKHAR